MSEYCYLVFNEDGYLICTVTTVNQKSVIYMTTKDLAELRELKYGISVAIIERICAALGCTPEEYGQVYDAENHEAMLRTIMIGVTDYTAAQVAAARDDELVKACRQW